ncbi:MAG TPA: hypothetical protein VML19_10100 [Verrucomicrobiae bacterium]|nr:hypothetical protein [Verrucomicrobiae bacterium]
MRDALVAALVACANNLPSRWRTKRFLTGLSSDELEFIAGYLGSLTLGSQMTDSGNRCESAQMAARDREHKMILVREFFGRTGLHRKMPWAPRWN